MWQKVLKQRDRPFYVDEVKVKGSKKSGKVLRLEGYDTVVDGIPTHALPLPQVDGNPIRNTSDSRAGGTDEAVEKSIGFLNSIVNQFPDNIMDINISNKFPSSTLNIQVESKSNREYKISVGYRLYSDDNISVTGVLDGYTSARLCIDVLEGGLTPVGDVLGSYILSLINDERSCEDIDTLQDFVDSNYYTEIQCVVCENQLTISIHDVYDTHQCPDCKIAHYSDIHMGENDYGETYMSLEHYDVEYINPQTGAYCTQIGGIENEGEFGDKYFIDEIYNMLLHYQRFGNSVSYYKAMMDEAGNYHGSLESEIEIGGYDYEEMSTGLYHKKLNDDTIENEGYTEDELEEMYKKEEEE